MSVETIEGKWPIVKADGEIDLANIDELRTAVDGALERSPKAFVIDLKDIAYIDSAGVAVVISAYRRINKVGGAMAIVRPASEGVRRVLDLIGLQTLPNVIMVDDAEAAEEQLAERGAKASI